MDSSCQIVELHGMDREYVSLTAPATMAELVSSVDTTNTGLFSKSNECDRILDVPRLNEISVGTLPSANAVKPVSSTSYGVPDVRIDPSMEQPQSCHDTRHDSAYTGMFSVEQHFVCLVCCRPTCFKTDAALVVHLRVHISEQTIKVKKQSEETPDNQMDDIQENSGENSKVPIVIYSVSDTNTETVCNNSKKIDDCISRPIELSLFDSKDKNDTLLSNDGTNNVLANNTMSDTILSENAIIADGFSECKIIPTIISKDVQPKDVKKDLKKNRKTPNQKLKDKQSDNVLLIINAPDIIDSHSDFTIDSKGCAPPRSMKASMPNHQLSTKQQDKVPKILGHYTPKCNQLMSSGIKPMFIFISDYVCTQCQTHFKNHSDLMLHLKVHSNTKDRDKIRISKTNKAMKAATSDKNINDVMIFTKQINSVPLCSKDINSGLLLPTQKMNSVPGKHGKTRNVVKPVKTTKRRNIKRNLSSESTQHVCEICDMVFSNRKDCSSHIKKVHVSKLCECDKCGKVFKFPRQLRDHLNFHSDTREFLCHLCPKTFISRQCLRTHLKMHTGVRPHHCTKCSYRAASKQNLVKHMVTHSDETHASCTICNKEFKRPASLNYHMTIHTGERLYKCDVCNKEFHYRVHLSKHKKSKHNSTENVVSKPFSCAQCNKTYTSRFGLKVHQRSQHMSVEKPYCCSKCGLKCASNYDLKRHTIRVHSEIKAFACTICGKGYTFANEVITHMKAHSINDPQPCIVCKQYFPEGEVSNHILNHEKYYSCSECTETFYIQRDLTEHLRIHFGAKPHICHVCKQRFEIVAHLLVHMQQQHAH